MPGAIPTTRMLSGANSCASDGGEGLGIAKPDAVPRPRHDD